MEGIEFEMKFRFYSIADANYVLKGLRERFSVKQDGRFVMITGRSLNPKSIRDYLRKWAKEESFRILPANQEGSFTRVE